MKISGREPAYEAARTWALHPVSHAPPGWAQIVRQGVAAWVHATIPACTAPLSESHAPADGCSPLLTIVAAMVAEVAEHLNERGWRTYEGKPFTAARVLSLRRYRRLKDHGTRLAERGWLSASDAASAYGVCRETLMAWGRRCFRRQVHTHPERMLTNSPKQEHANHAEGVQYAIKSFAEGQ